MQHAAPGVGDGQGSLVCCSPWGSKESDTTELLNWTELNWCSMQDLHSLTRDWTCALALEAWFPNYWTSPIRASREGTGTPLQYSCLENPMDGGAWWAAVHGVIKSRTQLSDFTFPFPFHALEKEMATHSSVLAWRIPGTGEPGGLPSMGLHRVGRDWSNLAAAIAAYVLLFKFNEQLLKNR